MAVMAVLLITGTISAQTRKIAGTVVDELGAPLIGSVVASQDGKSGAMTDEKGAFTLNVRSNDQVVSVSFLGYLTQNVNIVGRSDINVQLLPDPNNALNEVVVIGYGEVKKADLTGAVGNVKMSDIKEAPGLSVDQALQGRIAGVDIMSTTGEPGSATSIRIRGTRSITASNEPLIVVDGVAGAVTDLTDINSDDIESISVLKDASSTAIYGSRGSNGVIMVTTKGGFTTKPNITFKAQF
jgi:TonB-dependent SusC/RagA subfamily outer membrane receptor